MSKKHIPEETVYAFIDSQNLNKGVKNQGWKLDFKKFRVYLREKYKVTKCYLFIGYIPKYRSLYAQLKNSSYLVVFKPTLKIRRLCVIKGNVDAELVLHTMIELKNFDKAIIISGDGDFHCLLKYLDSINKLGFLIIPNSAEYSSLLRKFRNKTIFISSEEKSRLEEK